MHISFSGVDQTPFPVFILLFYDEKQLKTKEIYSFLFLKCLLVFKFVKLKACAFPCYRNPEGSL